MTFTSPCRPVQQQQPPPGLLPPSAQFSLSPPDESLAVVCEQQRVSGRARPSPSPSSLSSPSPSPPWRNQLTEEKKPRGVTGGSRQTRASVTSCSHPEQLHHQLSVLLILVLVLLLDLLQLVLL